jgi:hypothetical protein
MTPLTRLAARAAPVLWVILAVAAPLALSTWVSGGFRLDVLGWRVASFSVRRPFTAAAIAGLLLAVDPRVRARMATALRHGLVPLSVAGCAAFALTHAAPVAAAADMHGYVAQAADWWSGTRVHADWIDTRYFPAAASVPLGYVLRSGPEAAAVPLYPPGLSLHMAAARVVGDWAMYAVSPLGALALVLGTYALGRTTFDETSARIAAAAVACHPVLLAQATLPMSDPVAAAYWTWSLALASSPRPVLQAGAGVLAGVAVLVRPNLAPLLVGPAGCAVVAAGVAGLLRVGGGAAPAVAWLGWHHHRLYGAATATGYGSLAVLFSTAHVTTNAQRYAGWLWQTMSPLPLAGFALASAAVLRERRIAHLPLVLFAATNVAIYLVYQPWPHWTFARFLLPAVPVVLLFAVALARRVLTRPLAVAALSLVVIGWQMDFEQRSDLRRTNHALTRFAALPGELARRDLLRHPPVTRVHSGSLRYYGGITAYRWDAMSPEALRRGIDAARDAGDTPLLIDDSDDRQDFEQAFGSLSCWTDGAPLFVLQRHAEIRVLRLRWTC